MFLRSNTKDIVVNLANIEALFLDKNAFRTKQYSICAKSSKTYYTLKRCDSKKEALEKLTYIIEKVVPEHGNESYFIYDVK